MTCYQQMVLDYLEHYQPKTYRALKNQQALRGYVDWMVLRLFETASIELERLESEYGTTSKEYLRVQAEEFAIASLMPMPEEAPAEYEDENRPLPQIRTVISASRSPDSSKSNGWGARQ